MRLNMPFIICLLFAALFQVNSVTTEFHELSFIASQGDGVMDVTNCSDPVLLNAGENATFYCNVTVTIICNVNGKKPTLVAWLFNGEILLNGSNDKLVIKNVFNQTGLYSCIANRYNASSNATTVINYKVPRQPTIWVETRAELQFTTNFKILPVNVGSNITSYGKSLLKVFCNASGDPKPLIQWSKDGHAINNKYKSDNYLLLPHNVALSGKYVCKAINAFGEEKVSSYLRFIEPIPPKILSSRRKVTAIHGENEVPLKIGDDLITIAGTALVIKCLANGIPEPSLSWHYDNISCLQCKHSSDSYELLLKNRAIQVSESGNYTCKATNAFGTSSVTSYVEVIDPVIPFINSSSEEMIVYDMSFPAVKRVGGSIHLLVGASFILKCEVEGIPRPKITWKKDNLPILSSKRVRVSEEKVEVLGSLMSDTGWYSCIAVNGAGSATSSTFVYLIAPEKPHINVPYYGKPYLVNSKPTPFHIGVGINVVLLAYRELTLYCRATGFPPPVLFWEKNGYPLTNTEDIFVDDAGVKLVFRRLVPSQNGRYTCVASNAAGQDRKGTIVTSRAPYKAKLELRKSVLSSKYQLSPRKGESRVYDIPRGKTHLVAGSDVILECITKRSYPKARFKWFKDNKPLRRRIIESYNKSTLELRNVQKRDEGVYKCVAKNFIVRYEKMITIKLGERIQQNR